MKWGAGKKDSQKKAMCEVRAEILFLGVVAERLFIYQTQKIPHRM